MKSNEYPKQLYRQGWEDLTDTIVANDEAEEEAARADGFKMLSEEDGEGEAAPKPARAPRKAKAAE